MKCPICKKRIRINKDMLYHIPVSSFLIKNSYYECVDCPKCGCQIRLQERIGKKEEAAKP